MEPLIWVWILVAPAVAFVAMSYMMNGTGMSISSLGRAPGAVGIRGHEEAVDRRPGMGPGRGPED